MMRARFAVTALRPVERDILFLLRTARILVNNNANDSQYDIKWDESSLPRLARYLHDHGMDVRIPTAAFASMEELRLLACIAIAQRQNMRRHESWSDALRALLLDCGQALAARGMKLPHSTITRTSSLPTLTNAAPLPLAGEMEHADTQRISARARAMALVQSMTRPCTSDFAAVGVSRQTLSQLCKSGFLHRDERGRYRAHHDPA